MPGSPGPPGPPGIQVSVSFNLPGMAVENWVWRGIWGKLKRVEGYCACPSPRCWHSYGKCLFLSPGPRWSGRSGWEGRQAWTEGEMLAQRVITPPPPPRSFFFSKSPS